MAILIAQHSLQHRGRINLRPFLTIDEATIQRGLLRIHEIRFEDGHGDKSVGHRVDLDARLRKSHSFTAPVEVPQSDRAVEARRSQ